MIPLFWKLPKNFQGPVIFIRRSLQEVIQSQHTMGGDNASTEELEQVYSYYEEETLNILKQRSFPFIILSHEEVIANPQKTALSLTSFLGGSLNTKGMTEAVVPDLYRTKKGQKGVSP